MSVVESDMIDDEGRRPRRLVLRSLLGLAAAGVTLTGLAACGGGEDEEDEEEEDD